LNDEGGLLVFFKAQWRIYFPILSDNRLFVKTA